MGVLTEVIVVTVTVFRNFSRLFLTVIVVLLWSGCGPKTDDFPQNPADPPVDLRTARATFTTKLVPAVPRLTEPVEVPPPQIYNLVRFSSPAGQLVAYVSPDPKDQQKHPVVIWAHGGFY